MKKVLAGLALFSGVVFLSSCEKEVCIRCIEVSGTDVRELCSSDQNERHYFTAEWSKSYYNCAQVEE